MPETEWETDAQDVAVGEWSSLAAAHEHALVVLAMRLDCRVVEDGGRYLLRVEAEHEAGVRTELALYRSEQEQPVEEGEIRSFPAGLEAVVIWALVLVGMFVWQGRDPGLTERLCNSSVALVEGKEWWRPFTALFLHADAGHLLGNVAIGGVFCVMVAHTLGAARGWPLMLAAGTLGNAWNAWNRYPEAFQSLGASTLTFGALGILVGAAGWQVWRFRSGRWLKPLLVPVAAGLALLGLFGGGGENTDVGGHLAGWLCGAAAGAVAGRGEHRTSNPERRKKHPRRGGRGWMI